MSLSASSYGTLLFPSSNGLKYINIIGIIALILKVPAIASIIFKNVAISGIDIESIVLIAHITSPIK